MRTFVVKASKAHTSSNIRPEDLPGSGRLDLVVRCVSAALWLSHNLRDSEIYVVMEGPPNQPLTVKWEAKKMKRVSPDERSIALWLKKAIQGYETNKRANPGITVEKKSFRDLMESLRGRPIYILDESGKDIRKTNVKENPVIVIGDHIGLLPEDVSFLETLNGQRISIGPRSYLASQCIDYINIELDRSIP